MKRFSITTLAAFGILLGAVPVARAADATCGNQTISNATIAGNLVVTGACTLGNDVTVGGNVTVESGASLDIDPTSSPVKIGGNILTDAGCVFVFINFALLGSSALVTIGGNVEIDDCTKTNVIGPPVNIKGNLTCTGSFGCIADSVSVGGNVKFNNNLGLEEAPARVLSSTIGGNVEVNGNGVVTVVLGNTIGGNVQFNDNGNSSNLAGNKVGGNGEVDGNGPGSSATENTIGGNLACAANNTNFVGGPNMVHGKYLPSPGSQCF